MIRPLVLSEQRESKGQPVGPWARLPGVNCERHLPPKGGAIGH